VNFSVTAACALYHFGLETEHFHGHDCPNSGHTMLTWTLARSVTDVRYFSDKWMWHISFIAVLLRNSRQICSKGKKTFSLKLDNYR